MSGDMVERVARAMWERCHDESWDESYHSPITRQIYIDDARAAIEAMREPSEKMLAAVRDEYTTYETKVIWQAAIDAALSAAAPAGNP